MHNYPSLRNYAGGPAGGDMHAYAGAHQPMSGVPSSVSQPQHRYNNSSYASATQNPPHSRSRREAQGPLVITTTPVRSHADPSASLHDDIHPYALPPQPRGSGHASRSPSAAASAQPMNSAALLDDIKRTSDLIVEFRRLKAQGGSREEREHLRRQVHALKSSQAAALLMEQAKAVGHEGEGGAWRRTGSQQHRANREGQDSRQPGHPAVELFSSRDDRRQKQHQHTVQAGRPATAPATQRGQHSLPLHPLAAASSSEERAAQGGAHYHADDTSRQLATVPRAPIAAWVHEEERAWRSMCFAASLAEHHIRKEIIRKWEKKWWKLWAQFREGRVEICVAPRRSQTTVASAEPTTRWSHREELTGGEPKILVPPSDARTSGTGQLEAHPSAKDDAKLKAEEEARLQVEEEARRQAKKQARARAEEEARLQAEEEAKAKAEEEARLEAEEEARLKAEEDARLKAEEEARLQAEEEAKAEEEARLKAEEEARLEAEEEARLKAEEEARLQAEEDARLKAEEEARLQAEEEAKAEEEARLKAQEEARLQAEEEARLKAEEEARLKAEEEARLEAEEEARLQAEEEARLEAEEEARLQAEEAARLQADEDARLQAEEESELRGAYRDSVIKCCDALLSSLIAEAANSLDDAPIPKSDEEVRDDADSVSTGSARDIIATETDTASSLDESKEEAVNKDVTEEEQPAQEVDTEETRHDGHEDVTQAVLSVSEEVIEVFIGGAARIAEECAVAVAEETSARGHIAADEEMEWADLVKSVEQMRAEMAVQEAVPTGEDTAASVESSMPAEDDEAMHEELEGSSTSEKSAEKTAEAQEVLSEEDGDASEASEPPRLRDPNEVLDSCNALFIDLFQAALSDALVMHSKACADAEAEREESRGLLCNEEKEVRDAVLSAEEDSHRDLLDLITSGHREAKLLETERVTIQAIETLHQQEVEGRSAVAQSEEDAYQDTLSSMMIERDEIAATEAEAALADVDNESAAEDKAAQEPSYIEDGIGSEDGAHTESTQSLSQYPATEGETPHDTKAEMSALLAFADSFIDESIALAVTSVEVPTPLPASPFTPDALDESPEKEVPSAVDEATIEDSQDLGNSASAVTLDEVPVDTAAGDAEVLGDDSLMPPPPPPPAAAPAASGPISPHALAEAADAIVGGLIRDASESAGAEVRTELPTLKKPEEPTSTEPAPLCAAPTPQAGKNIADIDAGNAITSFILQDAGRSIMRVHEGMPDPQQQLTYQHVQRVLMDGMTAALKGANVRAVPDNVDAGSSTPTDTGALPTDWRLAVEAVADRVANDFMQHTAAMMLRKQAEQVLYTPCFQTTVQATQAAIATVDPLQLFSPATLSARDIAFLFSYYMELFKKGRAAANVAITSPDVMRFSQSVVSRNLFAPIPASNSEYLGSPIAPPLGVASPTSVYPTRVNPQPDWGGSTDVRRAGMTSVVFDHTLNNILDDMVADTVEWMGTLLMS